MLKANSLIYAIYVCLIASILCAAMLMVSGLYDRLNAFYSLEEDLYIDNLSTVNYALGNSLIPNRNELESASPGIKSHFATLQHGFIPVLLSVSNSETDTVKSAFLTGVRSKENTALYVADLSYRVSASGKVTLKGDVFVPEGKIWPGNIENDASTVKIEGKIAASERKVPFSPDRTKKLYADLSNINASEVKAVGKGAKANSFFDPTFIAQANRNTLEDVNLKGNIVVISRDSLFIRNTAVLEDVVVFAKHIFVEDHFKGSVQLLGAKSIHIGKDVHLAYPSVVCLYDESPEDNLVEIGENSSVDGAIVLCGKDFLSSDKGKIAMADSRVSGKVFCLGTFQAKGDIKGSIFTNKILHRTEKSEYGNYLSGISIDAKNRPVYFLDIPVSDFESQPYGIVKKVF